MDEVLTSSEGDEATIATLRAGDFFGELTVIDGAASSGSAVALEPVEALLLSRARFRGLLATDSAVRDALEVSLAAGVRRINDHVEELHFLDLPGRLAARLVRLAREEDPGATGPVELRRAFSQGDTGASLALNCAAIWARPDRSPAA